MKVKVLTDSLFTLEVRESTEPTLIFFFHDDMRFSVQMLFQYEVLANKINLPIRFYAMNAQLNKHTVAELNVTKLPALVAFDNGMLIDMYSDFENQSDMRLWLHDTFFG